MHFFNTQITPEFIHGLYSIRVAKSLVFWGRVLYIIVCSVIFLFSHYVV